MPKMYTGFGSGLDASMSQEAKDAYADSLKKMGDDSMLKSLMQAGISGAGLGGALKRRTPEEEALDMARGAMDSRATSAGYKKGGKVKKMAKGGSVKSSASKRADGCAQRGKTKGRMV